VKILAGRNGTSNLSLTAFSENYQQIHPFELIPHTENYKLR
jgi:hypothetical protein